MRRQAVFLFIWIILLASVLGVLAWRWYEHEHERIMQSSCVSRLSHIAGVKDYYYRGIWSGASNTEVLTWEQIAQQSPDFNNHLICPASKGEVTNVPPDCYDIGPYKENPSCKIRPYGPYAHALTNR